MADGEAYWRKATFKGTDVFVECDPSGEMKVDRGRVPMRYTLNAKKTYNGGVGNLTLLGTEVHATPQSVAPASAPKKKEVALDLRPGSIVAYTDGACSGNPGPAGYGVFIPDGEYAVEISGYLGDATNNIAELEAIRATLEYLAGVGNAIDLVSDSSYSIGVLTKGWKAKANQELIATIRGLVRATPNLRFHWIKGHAGHIGNEKADELARRAIETQQTTTIPLATREADPNQQLETSE